MKFETGELLIYRDRVYKKTWKVIKLDDHDEWAGYTRCYVISAPPEDSEDLNTIMDLPDYFLYRPHDLAGPERHLR